MKRKRTVCLILSIMMVLSVLSGCSAELTDSTGPQATIDPAQDATPNQAQQPETQDTEPSASPFGGFESYADALGLSTDKLDNSTISGTEMAQLLDNLVTYASPDKLEEWKALYPVLRKSTKALNRYDMLSALYLALWYIGGDYGYITPTLDRSRSEMKALEGGMAPTWDLFGDVPSFDIPDWGEDHYGTAACFYNISSTSVVDGKYPLDYDKENCSFHLPDAATYSDALFAVLRSVSIAEISYPPADTANSYIITNELLEKANANPVVTSEDHPRWTGFVLGDGNPGKLGTSAEDIELAAEWGFNSIRLILHYETIFSADAQTADLVQFTELDKLVAAAIENDMHLNILLTEIPGRNSFPGDVSSGFVSTADLDLFINPGKQEQTLGIYRTLAARYKDIPNYNLSITPFFEPLNYNRSTGLPAPEYTPKDVAAFLGKAIDVIREEDPDRLIIYEASESNYYDLIIEQATPTKAAADSRGNVIISYNACEGPYVYACMTSTEGSHIDNMNHSLDLQPYPNYIYSVITHIDNDNSLTLDGCLPAGTILDLYLENSHGGTLDIRADGVRLYSEKLIEQRYEVGERLSVYYPYAQSDKCVSITLDSDADEIVIACENGWIDICGIYLTLPDEYARERWYFVQAYDVYLGLEDKEGVALRTSSGVMLAPNEYRSGRKITIHDDLTYTSEQIWSEASTDTVNKFAKELNKFDGNCIIRFERGTFGGAIWSELREYYEDLLKSYKEYDFGWWSNDWWLLINDSGAIAESTYVEYAGYEHFNLELLKLLQQYQSSDRP